MQTKGRRVLSSSRATWRPISPPPQTMMWSRNAAICRSILRFSHRCERSPSTERGERADRVQDDRATHDDQPDRKPAAGPRQGMDRIEAHRGDGDHGHVERVKEPPPLDELIADGAERDDPDEEDQDLPETFPRAHDRATATPAVASWAQIGRASCRERV